MKNSIFNAWLNSNNVSKDMKDIMKKMNDSEINVAFNEKPINFGTAGYRAKIGPGNHYLNKWTYKQLTIGYAKFIKNKVKNKKPKVLVVHDNRKDAELFTNVVATTLYENGIIPILMDNNDLLPTPIASYLIRKMKLDGGINITASHNPKEYNGFKCYDNSGSQILPDDANKIISFLPNWKEILDSKNKIEFNCEYIHKKYIDKYFKDVISTLPNTKLKTNKIQLVYSSMHGTASYYMSNFLNKLGYVCVDVPSQNYPDAEFTNATNCNPEDPIALEKSIVLADTLNINTILASDPDADRLAIAIKRNNNWVFLNGNQAGIIETYYKLNNLKNIKKIPVVISTYISTNLIDKIANQWNGKIIRTPTGFKWIGDQINKLNKDEIYINGFEEAIGALPSTINRDKDSFQTAALILEIINKYSEKSMDLIDILENEIFPKFGHWFGETTSIKINGYDWKEKAIKIFNTLKDNDLKKVGNRKISKKIYNEHGDSIEYYFDNDSWVKFRISGTEPKFKIYTNLYAINDKKDIDLEYTKKLQEESSLIVKEIKEYLNL